MLIKKFLMTLLLFFTSSYSYSFDTFVVKNINFNGLQRVSKNSALTYSAINIGDKIDQKKIKSIIHHLYSTKIFENISVSRDKKNLVINVKEKPIIYDIVFSGNKLIKSDVLKTNLVKIGLNNGEILDRSLLFSFKTYLKNFYHNQGKYGTNITTKIDLLPFNYAKITFNFNEGISAKIKNIKILGNSRYNVNDLIPLLNIYHPKFSFRNILANNDYNKQKLADALENLRNFYLNNGYIKFKVKSVRVRLSSNKKEAYITINIHEGDRYKVVSFKTNNDLIKNELMNSKQFQKDFINQYYNQENIINFQKKIKDTLDQLNYPNPKININSTINDSKKNIDLYLDVDLRNKYKVHRISFKGNYLSQDSVLRREIQQKEGDYLKNKLIQQGETSLKNTGYFETVNTIVKKANKSNDSVDIIYQVKEKKTGLFNLGLGYSKGQGVNFELNILKDNIFGSGNLISFVGTKDSNQKYGEFLFKKNGSIFSKNFNIENRIFYNTFQGNHKTFIDYEKDSYGANINLNMPVFNNTQQINIGLDYLHNHLKSISFQVPMWYYLQTFRHLNPDEKAPELITKDFLINYGWHVNMLDNKFLPNSGSEIGLDGKITLPYSDNKFHKVELNFKNYLPLNKKNEWILFNHGHVGYGYGFQKKFMPFYENFYIGGFKTIRGFRTNSLGPKGVYFRKTPGCTNEKNKDSAFCLTKNAVGGNAVFSNSFELIFPTPFLSNQDLYPLRTSLFVDFGTIWDTQWVNTKTAKDAQIPNYNNEYKKVRCSAGIAITWISPIGPLSMSYAKPIKYYEDDAIENFQLTLGKTW
ncbi:outer membrane protein assembly factor BamA [Candidatus Tachikawaea gelatinosa]|uniref:Outer membrane protein assembly factor BamA n=1 Tax=Candidatus Tachikawaea gelatinosa TaxID=1410383 RepID=A0A090ARI9_9ENTR|nr:outer membrane protein assembly factor BamA [Candidatus Tachikawaea gelatinosa]BAP58400.1 outer membrane protein assembly factor BamA [Candidatus Tachikawaea gelatinosa]